MIHGDYAYIFITEPRKQAFLSPEGWTHHAFERFDYFECCVWRKPVSELTDKDREDWLRLYGDYPEEWHDPCGWEDPRQKSD